MTSDRIAKAVSDVLVANAARIAGAIRAKEDDGRSAPVRIDSGPAGKAAAEVTVSGAFAKGAVADAREAHATGTADARTPVVMRRIRTVQTPARLANGRAERTGRTGRADPSLIGTRVTQAPESSRASTGASTVHGNPAAIRRPGTTAGQERLVKAAVDAAIPRIRREVGTAARDALIAAVRSRRG